MGEGGFRLKDDIGFVTIDISRKYKKPKYLPKHDAICNAESFCNPVLPPINN